MIKFEKDNSIESQEIIHAKLREYNREKCQWLRDNVPPDFVESETKYCNILAFNDNELIGGAIGFVEYNWYVLNLLYVDEKYRGQDIGTYLTSRVEESARTRKLTGIRLETWNFQSRGFYEKNGYTVFAELKDCPPGTTVYFLKKEL